MNYISLLGLIVLLGIAWLLSYHKSEIKFRPIAWGIGLQLILALIILREDYWSFIGMSFLSLLIIVFIHQKDQVKLGGGILSLLIILFTSSILGYLLSCLPWLSSKFVLLTAIFLILNSIFKWRQDLQRFRL